MRESKVTIYEVAEAAGVSHTAASMALSGRPGVSEVQRQRIQKISQAMGYKPRLAAQMLASGKTGHIGLIAMGSGATTTAAEGFTSPILTAFLYVCATRNQRNLVEFQPPTATDADGRFEPPRQLSGGLVDGVVLAGHVSSSLRQWLEAKGCPYPWVSIDEPADYSVLAAADEGIEKAVAMLVGLGHRRIGFLGGATQFTTHRLKLEGFMRAVARHSLDTNNGEWISSNDPADRSRLVEHRVAILTRLLSGRRRPTALIAHGVTARDAVLVAARLGLGVPRDVSIVSYCTAAEAAICEPALTAIEPPFTTMVERAISLLQDRIDGIGPRCACEWITPEIVMRDTVAKASPT